MLHRARTRARKAMQDTRARIRGHTYVRTCAHTHAYTQEAMDDKPVHVRLPTGAGLKRAGLIKLGLLGLVGFVGDARMHARTHARTCTHAHTHVHTLGARTCTHARTRARTRTHARARTRMHARTRMPASTHAPKPGICALPHTKKGSKVHARTRMHASAHASTRARTCTRLLWLATSAGSRPATGSQLALRAK